MYVATHIHIYIYVHYVCIISQVTFSHVHIYQTNTIHQLSHNRRRQLKCAKQLCESLATGCKPLSWFNSTLYPLKMPRISVNTQPLQYKKSKTSHCTGSMPSCWFFLVIDGSQRSCCVVIRHKLVPNYKTSKWPALLILILDP